MIHSYLTFLQHFATGEGITTEIALVHAENKRMAIERHLSIFYDESEEDAKQYYRGDVAIFPADSPNSKRILNAWFKDSDMILKGWKLGGVDFYFKTYNNYS